MNSDNNGSDKSFPPFTGFVGLAVVDMEKVSGVKDPMYPKLPAGSFSRFRATEFVFRSAPPVNESTFAIKH